MQKYVKTYLKAFGHDPNDPTQFVPCEVTGDKSVDVHHIIGRGKGGPDTIENLMAVTREIHLMYGDKKHLVHLLFKIHERHMKLNGVKYDKEVLSELRKQYIEI